MSINIENVIVVKPQGMFNDPIMFDILFECTVAIPTSIRWDVIYVGSATSHDFDQTLASVFVGPIEIGMNRFVLTADPPVISKIPPEDFPLTVIMLKAYFKDQEFIRIGYYVSNTAPDDSETPDPAMVERQIVTEDTTVHQSQINWG
jgi:histone chaperone ASF1